MNKVLTIIPPIDEDLIDQFISLEININYIFDRIVKIRLPILEKFNNEIVMEKILKQFIENGCYLKGLKVFNIGSLQNQKKLIENLKNFGGFF